MKVLICIPFLDNFEPAKSGLRELVKRGRETHPNVFEVEDVQITVDLRMSGPYLAAARNSFITNRTKDVRDFDVFCFIDSDIVWKLDDLIKCVKQEREILCASYAIQGSKESVCGHWEDMNGSGTPGGRYIDGTEQGMKQIGFCGGGFLIIKKSVFAKIEYPFFRHHIFSDMQGNKEETTCDYGFCWQAKMADIPVWCDFDIKLGHVHRKGEQYDWEFRPGKSSSQGMTMTFHPEEIKSILLGLNELPHKVSRKVIDKIAAKIQGNI